MKMIEYTPQADYNDLQAKSARQDIKSDLTGGLDLTNLPIEVFVKDINKVSNDEYILLRRNGLGASDSSIVLGCNPFKSKEDLIKEKISTVITEEERAIAQKTAVRKGRDLEPLIIQKFQDTFQQTIFKPTDMYRFKEFPYLTVNFDGITGTPEQYFPAEIKVVTMAGEKYYDFTNAMYRETKGFLPLPDNHSNRNWSIDTKAHTYGIPAYYYTQLQQQMLALNAPFGHLVVLIDSTWELNVFLIWQDKMVQNELIVQGYKIWNIIKTQK